MGILLSEATDAAGNGGYTIMYMVIWVAFIVLMFWLMGGSQRKEQKRLNAMLADMQIGDNVLTTSGFYGMVIDISEDSVIVEFGSNKNCRIPMKKSAIAQIEKPGAE
ncbi:MAG: preprotein translocase subunit YajC [Lachnospiraceae bacterium]|nr:preprotein translocase subunit YajC [Lachnospiraceae bacterium]